MKASVDPGKYPAGSKVSDDELAGVTWLPDAFRGEWTYRIRSRMASHLRSGDMSVMDNLQTHEVKGAARAVEERDAPVLNLPADSPDFDPVERVFSELETGLRRRELRTIRALEDAFGESLDRFTQTPMENRFAKSGYTPRGN